MNMKRIACILALVVVSLGMVAQPKKVVLSKEEGRITFAVDDVELPESHCGWKRSGMEIAQNIHLNEEDNWDSDWKPEILACSFDGEDDLYTVGEDVLFQMLKKAWSQHRPVVLTPDAIWLVICQQFSHYVNENSDAFRGLLVSHEGQKVLEIETADLLEEADWESLVAGFTAQIDKYTNNNIGTTLVADFSTSGTNERIASEVTLMDVVKPYFKYEVIYVVCGIPTITLTGTPDDWRKVLEKTRALEKFGMGWWVEDLEPILEQFIQASEGKPDYWFWKDIVMKTRPRSIQGPTCGARQPKMTEFDGWFLKLFPFDNEGRTPEKVTIKQTVLPETVAVPVAYKFVLPDGTVMEEHPLELVAGIVGVQENSTTLAMEPKIGWFVRTVKTEEQRQKEQWQRDSLLQSFAVQQQPQKSSFQILTENTPGVRATPRYWDEGPLVLSDFSYRRDDPMEVMGFEYGVELGMKEWKKGNTKFRAPVCRSYMDPLGSWVNPDYVDQTGLRYLQSYFDCVELYSRYAQRDLFEKSYFNPHNVVRTQMGIADKMLSQMGQDTDGGQNVEAVEQYGELIRTELAKTDNLLPTDMKCYPQGWGIGMHLGASTELYTGEICDYVTPITGIDFGFDIPIWRFNIFAGFVLGWGGHYKQDIPRDGYQWNAGERMMGGNCELSLGFTALDSPWWRVIPFAGIGKGFLDYPTHPVDPEQDSDEIGGFRYLAGLSTDFKFFRLVEFGPAKDGLSELSVRARVFVAHTAFPEPAPAWSLNFGLSVNMLAWMMRK